MIIILRSILSIITAVVIILFALANRDMIDVVISPVHDDFAMPVFVLGLGGVMVGFIIGAVLVWLNGSKVRKERRTQGKLIKKMEKELKDANEKIDVSGTAMAEFEN